MLLALFGCACDSGEGAAGPAARRTLPATSPLPPVRACAAGAFAPCQADCEAGKAFSCTDLGAMLLGGKGAPADASRAAAYFGRGCDGGDLVGCVELGALLESGRGTGPDAP